MIENKILILGSKGALGQALVKVFPSAEAWDRHVCDVTDFPKLREKILELKPEIVINCVAYNNVDGAETDKEAAFKLNSDLPAELSKICNQLYASLVHFSTNYVFDGEKGEYMEADIPNPISVYGQSKADGEKTALGNNDKTYLIRTSVIFGRPGQSSGSKKDFVQQMLSKVENGDKIKAVDDLINSLTYSVDLAATIKLILEQQKPFGIYHITNSGSASWYTFAKEIFQITGKQTSLEPVSIKDFPRAAQVPKKSVLINTKLPQSRPWQEALKEFLSTIT